MKVLVTGGHLAPAIATIDELVKNKKTQVVFIGRKYNGDREKTLSLEYQEITSRAIPFTHLNAGRLNRFLSLRNIPGILNIPGGFFESFVILLKEKPDKILSFGGYLALPIAVAGAILGIPVYTHEQTIRPGLTNRLISIFATKVFLSFPESQPFFPKEKSMVTGNPIRQQIFAGKQSVDIPKDRKVIYITGGSLGSHSVNAHILTIVVQLLQKFTIVHQTGNLKEYRDYEQVQELRNSLPDEEKRHYIIKEHFTAEEVGSVFSRADLIVGRSGANTFFELIALKKPSVLIPLPQSAYGEQEGQARLLQKNGVAEVFNQSGSAEELLSEITKVMNSLPTYKKNFDTLQTLYKPHAAEKIAAQVSQDS